MTNNFSLNNPVLESDSMLSKAALLKLWTQMSLTTQKSLINWPLCRFGHLINAFTDLNWQTFCFPWCTSAAYSGVSAFRQFSSPLDTFHLWPRLQLTFEKVLWGNATSPWWRRWKQKMLEGHLWECLRELLCTFWYFMLFLGSRISQVFHRSPWTIWLRARWRFFINFTKTWC